MATAFSGNVTINYSSANFVATTGGEVRFSGNISGNAVVVGGNVQVEGNVASGGTAAIPGITIPGFGEVVFTGGNFYTGGTTINGGELLVATPTALPNVNTTGSVTVVGSSGGVLALNGSSNGWTNAQITSFLGDPNLHFPFTASWASTCPRP